MEKQQNPSLWRWAEDCPILHPEAAKDCILPDSYPDIHKILYTTANCIPGKVVFAGGKLQAEGILQSKVLFSDEEGNLHEVRFQIEYNGQMPYTAEEGIESLWMQSSVDAVTARALNPRKLSIRGKLSVAPLLFYRCAEDPRMAPELAQVTLEKKLRTVTAWQIDGWSEQGIEAGEDLSLTHEAPIGRLIYSDLRLETLSCTAGDGEVRFSGNGILSLLYATPEGALHLTDLTFPIQSSVRGEATSDSLCKVVLTPETVSVVPTEDAAGEARGVELDFTYSLAVTTAKRLVTTRPVDCYSVDAPTSVEEETVEVLCDLREISKEFSRNLEGDSDGMTELLRGYANVYVDSEERTEEGTLLHCTAQVTLLGKNAEGMPMSVQLVENFPIESEGGMICCPSFTATPSGIAEGGRVKVRLQGRMSGLAATKGQFSYVGAVLPATEELRSQKDSLTLCYPAHGETLWDIAKRYRTTQSALLSANSIGEGELPAVLLIPRA